MLEVIIMPPAVVRERLEAEGQPYPTKQVKALIDTGASISVIRPEIAAELGLVQTGFQKIASVQNEQDQPVFFGGMGFPWGKVKDLPLVACPLTGTDCLIGRDVLQHWRLTYDGGDGSIVICD